MASTALFKNHLLSALAPADLALLTPDLERLDLKLRQVLEARNKRITHAYFIEHGLASIVAAARVTTKPAKYRNINANLLQVAYMEATVRTNSTRSTIRRSVRLCGRVPIVFRGIEAKQLRVFYLGKMAEDPTREFAGMNTIECF